MAVKAHRPGSSMMAPDYPQWHGMYEVAHRFYMEMVPQLRELIEHNRSGPQALAAPQLEAKPEEVLNSEMHRRWFQGGTSEAEKAARKAAREAFNQRYTR